MPSMLSTRLPSMALASPPPALPGPGVGAMNSAVENPRTPSIATISRIQPSTTTPSAVAARQANFITLSATRLRRTSEGGAARIDMAVSSVASIALPHRHARDQETRQHENDEGDDEQDAAQREQRVEVQAVRLVELVGEPRGDGGARFEQRRRQPVRIADDEGHGHRLAKRAPQPQHGGADEAGAGLRDEHVAHDLPCRAADAKGALAQRRRDLVEHVARDRGNQRHDHDAEDDAGGEDA